MLPKLLRLARKLRDVQSGLWVLWAWRRAVARSARMPDAREASASREVVIVPSDPWALVGAKGDEAMITAVLREVRREVPSRVVSIVTATRSASEHAERLGCRALAIWSGPRSFARVARACGTAGTLLVIGADIMDGHYVPLDALTRWFLADVAARQGVQSTILGFSFNHHPPAWLRYALNSISNRVAIKVRDPISLERFQRFTRARAELVADVAFLLEPRGGSQAAERIQEWAQRRRSEGDVVLGFNIHPMLIRDMDGARVRALVDGARRGLTEIMEHGGVSVLLIPHDDRGTKGDLVCLAPLRETLAGRFGDRVTGPASGLGAAELKAAVGSTDAVITGRMHLAIAALGQGKPVGVLTYQDKFQGLFELFGLPKRLLIDPESRTFSGDLYAAIAYLLQERSGLEQLVTSRLPGIRVMARGNFDARA